MDRPKVVILTAASVDGRVAVSRDSLLLYGDKRWDAIQGPGDFDLFEWLKATHKPEATLEGSGSFVRDDELPSILPAFEGDPLSLFQDFLPGSVLQRPGHIGWFTAVDGRGRIRWQYKEYPDEAWRGWHTLVWVAQATPPDYLAYLRREEIPYLVAGENRVDLEQALRKMKTLLGVNCILSTAGGKLNGALLRAGLVDEINIEFHPGIIGSLNAPSLFDSPDLKPDEMPVRLKLIWAQVQAAGRVWLRYEVCREDK